VGSQAVNPAPANVLRRSRRPTVTGFPTSFPVQRVEVLKLTPATARLDDEPSKTGSSRLRVPSKELEAQQEEGAAAGPMVSISKVR
jgi:hypothetical protein